MAKEYSDDRKSLAQEIAEGLRSRGYWVPKDYVGPDLITAISFALETQSARDIVIERDGEAINIVIASEVDLTQVSVTCIDADKKVGSCDGNIDFNVGDIVNFVKMEK